MNTAAQATPHPLSTLMRLMTDVEENFTGLTDEFASLKNSCCSSIIPQARVDDDCCDHVTVSRADLDRLQHAVRTTNDLLPEILSRDTLSAVARVRTLDQELSSVSRQLQMMTAERDHWKSQFDAVNCELISTRKGRFEEAGRVNELTSQLSQQTEYSSSMGAACATLLWRVSRSDDAVQTLLTGVKVDEFLEVVSTTVETYAQLFTDGNMSTFSSSTDESHFMLALCGVITNVAASAYGRELLMSKDCGRRVVDVFLNAVYNIPPKLASKLKNLMLMSVYNVSINQKGFKYLRSKPSLIAQLAWLVQSERDDAECRLNALRLVQSMLFDDNNSPSTIIIHEAREVLSEEVLCRLATDRCTDVKSIALELINTLHSSSSQLDDVEP